MSEINEPPFDISPLITASGLVDSGASFIKRLIVTVAGATTPRIKIIDGINAGGTVRFDFNPPAISSLVLDITCSTGIYVEIAGTTPPQCYVLYSKLD